VTLASQNFTVQQPGQFIRQDFDPIAEPPITIPRPAQVAASATNSELQPPIKSYSVPAD
jgi:hypothetical protein